MKFRSYWCLRIFLYTTLCMLSNKLLQSRVASSLKFLRHADMDICIKNRLLWIWKWIGISVNRRAITSNSIHVTVLLEFGKIVLSFPFVQLTSLQSLQMSQFKIFNVQPIFSIFFRAEIGTVETGMDPIFDKLIQFWVINMSKKGFHEMH